MESTFDKLRREWAQKFSTVDQVKKSASSECSTATSSKSAGFRCELPLGWALQSLIMRLALVKLVRLS